MKSGPYDLLIVQEIQNNFYIIQKNTKAAAIFSATFSLCSIVISWQNSHDTASKHYGGGNLSVFGKEFYIILQCKTLQCPWELVQ